MLREDAAHSETHLTLTMESLLPEAKQPSSRRDLQGALKLRHEEHFSRQAYQSLAEVPLD